MPLRPVSPDAKPRRRSKRSKGKRDTTITAEAEKRRPRKQEPITQEDITGHNTADQDKPETAKPATDTNKQKSIV
jgi:hypothetical protein